MSAQGVEPGPDQPDPPAAATTELEPPASPSSGGRRPAAPGWSRFSAPVRREMLLALLLLFCYGFFRQVPVWNEYSRYDLVRALVEDGTTSIDRFQGNTGDKAYYQGHYYSDKAPGTALMGVPVYLLVTLTAHAVGVETPAPLDAIEALVFVECGVLTVLLVLLLLRFLRPVVGERWALVMSLGYGLGSIAFPLATMFFGHAASAFFLFAAFYLLWRWRADGGSWRPLLAGLLAGCAVITEVPVVLGVAVLGLYALRLGRGPALRFVSGGIPILLVFMAYNWLTFGGPFSLGYQYATLFGPQNSQGIVSIVWPSWTTALDLLLGPRGLLRLAPWFCVVPLGVLAYRRRVLQAEIAVCAAICCVFLVYNSGALNPFGGWTPGPRYLLPALPFAAILVALAPAVIRPFTALLMAVAAAIFLAATVTMPNAPELYRDPLYDLWLPRLLGRDLGETIAWLRFGLHGLEPLLILLPVLAVGAVALVATFRAGTAARRATLLVAGTLVALIVAFALPFPPPSAVAASNPGEAAGSIAIADAGVTPVATSGRELDTIWAQLDNRGPALSGTRVAFAVLAPDGRTGWSAWVSDVSWGAGERRRFAVDWSPGDAQRGDYRVQVSVLSNDGQTVFMRADGVAVAHVGP